MSAWSRCDKCGLTIEGDAGQIEMHILRCGGKPAAAAVERHARHGDILAAARHYVEGRGGAFFLTSQGHRLKGSPGIPDSIVFVRLVGDDTFPALCFFDAKTPDDEPTPAQEHFARLAEEAGVDVIFGGVDALRAFVEGGEA